LCAWRRQTGEHHVRQFNIQPADSLSSRTPGTGRRQLRKRAKPTGSRNSGQKWDEKKGLGRGVTHCRGEANKIVP